MNDEERSRRPLFRLVADIPRLLVRQAKNEFSLFAQEMSVKLKRVAIGVGLFAGAAFVGLFMLTALLAAAILGLATVLPSWLAALIIGVLLLIIVAILVLVGIRILKRGLPPTPTHTIRSVRQDVNAVKGIGNTGTRRRTRR